MKIAETIEKILATSVEEVIASSLSLDLLKVYSVLYLDGAAPKACAAAQRKYYNILKLKGVEMAKEIENRTCAPAWKGLRFTQKTQSHFLDTKITDKQAMYLIRIGALSEKDFTKLPEGLDDYLAEAKAQEERAAEAKADEEPKEKIKDIEEFTELLKKYTINIIKAQGSGLNKLSAKLLDLLANKLELEIKEDDTKKDVIAAIEAYMTLNEEAE